VTARSLDFHSQLRLNHCWELGCRLLLLMIQPKLAWNPRTFCLSLLSAGVPYHI
ncbi:mCG1036783, partial [Mus musculus]